MQVRTLVIPMGQVARNFYTKKGVQTALKDRSTLSLLKESAMLRVLGNKKISGPLGDLVKKTPDGVLDTPPISWILSPIMSQFGTVNPYLEKVLDGFNQNDVADLAKEGIGIHEDPQKILDRHLLTVQHPNVKHMALKLSSFVPFSLLQSGIETPAYEKGVAMMREVCDFGQRLDKKIYIDAEGVPEQRLIEKAQLKLGAEFNDTAYLTFQSMRSDTPKRLEAYLEFCLKTGLTPLIKQVKGAYHTQESPLFPDFYHPTFGETDSAFRAAIAMVGQFPGKKHQFIGTMNPELIDYAGQTLPSAAYVIANLKGMDVAAAMGIQNALIYHPIALKPSEIINYGVRRLIELGDPKNLTGRRLSVLEEALVQRLPQLAECFRSN